MQSRAGFHKEVEDYGDLTAFGAVHLESCCWKLVTIWKWEPCREEPSVRRTCGLWWTRPKNLRQIDRAPYIVFVRYIDAVKRRGVPMGQAKVVGENDDLVRIMTIHKSKGLEFPLVIVCGMGRRLNYTKIGSGIALHKDIGIGMTLTDFEGHWYKQTPLQRLIQKQIHKEEVSEEIRVLYVALTRAKDLLYLTGTVRDGAKFMESRQIGLGGDTMYLDMIGDVSRFELVDANRLSPDSVEKAV